MNKTIEICDGRFGIECTKQAQVFWPNLGQQWCVEHAPSDPGWMPRDDYEIHLRKDNYCLTCNQSWPCTHERERARAEAMSAATHRHHTLPGQEGHGGTKMRQRKTAERGHSS